MVILKSVITVLLSSLKYPFFSEKAFNFIKKYTPARTYVGLDRYASYQDFGEKTWKIGYGSEKINGHYLNSRDKATQEEIDKQFYYYNTLMEADWIYCHNKSDINYYVGLGCKDV